MIDSKKTAIAMYNIRKFNKHILCHFNR